MYTKTILTAFIYLLLSEDMMSQNIGIGTNTPQSKLHVAGQVRADSLLIEGNQTAVNLFAVRNFSAGVDQQQALSGATYSGAIPAWQSFTAGINGALSNFEFYWFIAFSTNMDVRIYEGEGLGGSILFSKNINTTPGVFGGYPFTNVGVSNVTVTAGSRYTIWLSNGNSWAGSFGNTYAAGISDKNAAFDYAFKSFVAGSTGSLVVNNAGNVGIGNIAPTVKLDITGDAKVSGTLTTVALNATSFTATNVNGTTLNISNLASQNLAANGYAKIGGLTIQWGVGNYNSNSDVTITYPVAFTTVYSVTATVEQGIPSGSGVNIPCKIANITNSNFIYAGTQLFSGDATSKVRWMAIGH